MALQIPFLHGTTQENNTFAAPAGVITIDTEKKELRIHDGLTFGGHVIPNIDRIEAIQSTIEGLDIAGIEGLQEQLDLKLAVSLLGINNGIVPLDETAKVSPGYLPSFVDDVLEVESLTGLPVEGEPGKLYVTKDTELVYRWSVDKYRLISASIEDTDKLVEGYINLYYTPERVRNVLVVSGDISYEMESGVFTIHTPFETVNGQQVDVNKNIQLDKSHVGLGSVMDYGFANETDASMGESSTLYLSPLGTRQALSMIKVKRTESQWLLDSGTLAEFITTEDGAVLTTEDGVDLDFEF